MPLLGLNLSPILHILGPSVTCRHPRWVFTGYPWHTQEQLSTGPTPDGEPSKPLQGSATTGCSYIQIGDKKEFWSVIMFVDLE